MLPENVNNSVSIIHLVADLPETRNPQTNLLMEAATNNHVFSSGTCFFYRHNEKYFIATNRHIFDGKAKRAGKEYPAKHVSVRLNLPNGGTVPFDVPLGPPKKPAWKSHGVADVALLPFVPPDAVAITAWSDGDILPFNVELEIAEPVICVGYPLGFYDKTNNRPVLRHGSIATQYGVLFMNRPYFLTDAVHFHGNSGTPIITRPKSRLTIQGQLHQFDPAQCFLLGVHSKREYVAGAVKNEEQQLLDLGLGVTWFASVLQDIAAQF